MQPRLHTPEMKVGQLPTQRTLSRKVSWKKFAIGVALATGIGVGTLTVSGLMIAKDAKAQSAEQAATEQNEVRTIAGMNMRVETLSGTIEAAVKQSSDLYLRTNHELVPYLYVQRSQGRAVVTDIRPEADRRYGYGYDHTITKLVAVRENVEYDPELDVFSYGWIDDTVLGVSSRWGGWEVNRTYSSGQVEINKWETIRTPKLYFGVETGPEGTTIFFGSHKSTGVDIRINRFVSAIQKEYGEIRRWKTFIRSEQNEGTSRSLTVGYAIPLDENGGVIGRQPDGAVPAIRANYPHGATALATAECILLKEPSQPKAAPVTESFIREQLSRIGRESAIDDSHKNRYGIDAFLAYGKKGNTRTLAENQTTVLLFNQLLQAKMDGESVLRATLLAVKDGNPDFVKLYEFIKTRPNGLPTTRTPVDILQAADRYMRVAMNLYAEMDPAYKIELTRVSMAPTGTVDSAEIIAVELFMRRWMALHPEAGEGREVGIWQLPTNPTVTSFQRQDGSVYANMAATAILRIDSGQIAEKQSLMSRKFRATANLAGAAYHVGYTTTLIDGRTLSVDAEICHTEGCKVYFNDELLSEYVSISTTTRDGTAERTYFNLAQLGGMMEPVKLVVYESTDQEVERGQRFTILAISTDSPTRVPFLIGEYHTDDDVLTELTRMVVWD